MKRVAARKEVFSVIGDMCEQGVKICDEHGEGMVRKTTGYLTDPDALRIHRQGSKAVKCGQFPGANGPEWDRVRRRVTWNLTNGVILQDLKDVRNATTADLQFELPKQCREIETVFYYLEPGKQWRRHIPLLGGKAKQCEVYPNKLLRSIMKGLKKQLQKLRPMNSLECGPTNEEVDVDLSLAPDDLQLVEDDWTTFTDEISGKAVTRRRDFCSCGGDRVCKPLQCLGPGPG